MTTLKKILVLLIVILFATSPAYAKYQRGYYKPSTRSFVSGHYKTKSDGLKSNNYSTKGNRNPYTGKKGYSNPYRTKPIFGNKK